MIVQFTRSVVKGDVRDTRPNELTGARYMNGMHKRIGARERNENHTRKGRDNEY
jgi:hypothetical protein